VGYTEAELLGATSSLGQRLVNRLVDQLGATLERLPGTECHIALRSAPNRAPVTHG